MKTNEIEIIAHVNSTFTSVLNELAFHNKQIQIGSFNFQVNSGNPKIINNKQKYYLTEIPTDRE